MVRPKRQYNSAYTPEYNLLEKARESWNYSISDKLVYRFKTREIALDFPIQVTKEYLEFRNSWIECHLTFTGKRDFHYCIIVELCESEVLGAKRDESIPYHEAGGPMNRNPGVLVNVAQLVQPPKQMTLNCPGTPSVIRLKRFDNLRCLCGYAARLPIKPRNVLLLQNGKLGVLGVARSGVDFRQTPDQLVKRRAETIQEIPYNEGDFIRNIFDLHPNDVQSIFKIILSNKTAGFVTENREFFPQVFKMYLRPGCFEIGINQRHDP